MSDPMIAELEAEAARLLFTAFDENTALVLGQALLRLAQARDLPLVIDIRAPQRCLFHAALPGSAPINANWARRKSNVAFAMQEPSLLVGRRLAEKGQTLAHFGLAEADHAAHGGAVPIRVRGVGVVAVATVSGLPQIEDHRLVAEAIAGLLEG